MNRTFPVLRKVAMLFLAAAPMVAQNAPFVFRGGVANSASFTDNQLPGGGIARGSIFSIFGRGLGPAVPLQVSSFPLPTELGGTSVIVRQGPRVFSVLPLFVFEGQINAILPSNTPTGLVSLQVTFNGRAGNWVPVRVVDHSPGIFTATGLGRGWGILQNFLTPASQPLNSGASSIRPGQVGTLWLTGTGAIQAPDNQPPPVGDLPYSIEIFVGGRLVTQRLYAGRAPLISGLDQYVITIPNDAPLGCFVPVYVRVNGTASSAVTIAITNDGGACSDSHNPISSALLRGGKIVHGIIYRGTTSAREFAGIDADFSADKAAVRAMEEAGGQFAFDPFLAAPPPGTCTNYSVKGNIMQNGIDMSARGRPLDLGALSISSLTAEKPLDQLQPGLYNSVLASGFPSMLSLFFGQGASSLRGTGGADGGAFNVSFANSPQLDGFNADQLRVIDRAAGFNVTWNAQPSVSALIIGGVYDQVTNSSTLFSCVSSPGASSLRVPDYVLGNLPATRGATDLVEARLFLSAMPALRETTTPGQVRVFTARQDVVVRSIQTVR
ncbi:MAG: hypothetical protein K2X03_16050 [Bryobacteraceae bacterium]|nr:hypothetical protein [Bryobacteraceae bacterium]